MIRTALKVPILEGIYLELTLEQGKLALVWYGTGIKTDIFVCGNSF